MMQSSNAERLATHVQTWDLNLDNAYPEIRSQCRAPRLLEYSANSRPQIGLKVSPKMRLRSRDQKRRQMWVRFLRYRKRRPKTVLPVSRVLRLKPVFGLQWTPFTKWSKTVFSVYVNDIRTTICTNYTQHSVNADKKRRIGCRRRCRWGNRSVKELEQSVEE